MDATKSTSETLYCSFCRKDKARVEKLVAGPGVYAGRSRLLREALPSRGEFGRCDPPIPDGYVGTQSWLTC